MPLDQDARRAANARETSEVFIELIRITSPQIPNGPLRFANSRTDIMSRGLLYDGTAFSLKWPSQVEAGDATATIVIQNVDRLVEAALAVLTSEPTFAIEAVLARDPDTVVIGPYRLPLRSSETAMNELRLTLGGSDPFMSRLFPRRRFSQADFPGLSRT